MVHSDYKITVETGDLKGAGTNANVYIILHDDKGQKSKEIKLDVFMRNDFERGRRDIFTISGIANLGDIRKIELRRDTKGIADDWYVDVVEVQRIGDLKKHVFPVHRWVDWTHHVQEFDCCLPQDDQHSHQRRDELVEKKQLYKFESKNKGLPPQVGKVDICGTPLPSDWLLSVGQSDSPQSSSTKDAVYLSELVTVKVTRQND
ncbi:polyunsaturated fatty acid 5-lipoxygenase-like [Ptychodera flava]|uniref:polyunsaturated fatty acid 5-lipoxygenase-like n=1 Tax=Ptychodera flava TaxID=63121 RepID=UPI003969C095